MAVTLTGGDGFFDRLGVIIDAGTKLIDTHGGTANTEWSDIADEYANSLDILGDFETDGVRETAKNAGSQAIYNQLRRLAERTLIEMVKADNPQPDESVQTALEELIRQMVASSDTLDSNEPSPTSSSTVTGDSGNTGDGSLILYGRDPDGRALEAQRAEDIVFVCTKDAQTSGTAGQETFQYRGEPTVPAYDDDWPGGSGANGTLRVSSPDRNAERGEGGNVATNGNFETFTTSNVPANWTIEVGAAGTNVFEEGTETYRGSKALRITGNSTTLTMLSQTVRSASIRNLIQPSSVYFLTARFKKSASLAAGTIKLGVRDGSGTTLDGGNAETSITAAATTTTYSDPKEIWFATPAALSDEITIDIETTVALTVGEHFYIDDLMLVRATPLYTGGAYAVFIPGDTPFVKDDRFVATIGNSQGGLLVSGLDRYFDLLNRDLRFPTVTGGGETVTDAEVA